LQITRVELKNIKNHAEAEFTFQPGVIAICGPNGAGKTTILEAIAWALFDQLEYKRDDFVKRGAKKGQVAVGFISDKDGREYIVTRDTAGVYQVYDPDTKTRLVEQKNQVVKWLRSHIGVDENTDLTALFKSTIGVPQGAFTYDFTLAPANRKAVFDQILKVEEYRLASDKLRDTLKYIEGRIADADRKLAEAEGELKAFDETRRQHDEAATRLRQLAHEHAAAQFAREQTAATVARLDELKQQLDAQRGALERLQDKLKINQAALASLREALAQARQAAEVVAAARRGFETYQAVSASLAELERQRLARDELRAGLARIERELIETQSQAARQRERLAELEAARQEKQRLAVQIAAQTKLEKRLAELREQRGELQSLERSHETYTAELEKLRQRYTTLSREIEKAEALRAQAESVAGLEQGRAQIEAALAQQELALKSSQLQRDYLDKARQQETRLTTELRQRRAELARLEPQLALAARLTEIETRQQRESERLALLRAEVARDEEMIQSLASGGICPLLTEKCLNLKPGESLETRFRSGLETRRAEIIRLQDELTKLADELKAAHTAAAATAQLPRLQAEVERLARELAAQNAQTARLADELAQAGQVSDAELETLKGKRDELEKQLREAREAERVFNQAEVLRAEMTALGAQGKAKRAEAEKLQQRLAQISDSETRLAAAENELRALNDPRGRATALQQLIEREPEWSQALAQAEEQSAAISASRERALAELQSFAALDAQIAEAGVLRANNERDYHAYLSNLKIAETLDVHEEEAATLAGETAETERTLNDARGVLQQLEVSYNAETHSRAQLELEQWRERATQLATQLAHTQEHFAQLQTRLAQLNEARERWRAQLGEKEKAQRLRETTDFIRDILQKAAPFITEAYLFSISQEANQLFREITGRYELTLRWAKDYEITLEEEGRERPFANLSGGEQMAAALAVRLALLKELAEINLAFFDEPTANLDEERRRNLAQQIGRIKDFQQLFVISHDDTFEGYTDQVIALGEKSAN
jgi:exonuclease SbcC